MAPMRIAIVGAGLIGLNLGGRMVLAGEDVTFFGRAGYKALIEEHGLTVSGLTDEPVKVENVKYETDLALLDQQDWDFILVTLKAVNTGDLANAIKGSQRKHTIVSMQNGVSNADDLRQACSTSSSVKIIGTMVPYNVVLVAPAHFHQATLGDIVLEECDEAKILCESLVRAKIAARTHPDIKGVLYAKLLINLNNSVNALSGLPIKQQLSDGSYRYIAACLQQEALQAYNAAGIQPAAITPMPMWLLPYVLQLPNWLFLLLAQSMLRIDETAKSSMFDDLDHGRLTEIDQLNGEIVRLGEIHGVPTPMNRRVVDLMHQVEAAKQGSPRLSAQALLAKLSGES